MRIESLKIFSLEDNLLKRLSTDKGNFLMMKRGWLDCLCIQFISLQFVLLHAREEESIR